MGQLTAQGIKKLGDGRHADGEGLFFFVRGNSRIWVYRFQLDRKRRDMQLGKYPAMSLKDARDARYEAARLRDAGVDPVEARMVPAPARQSAQILRVWVGRWLRKNRHTLKDSGRSGRWLSPVKVHILPKLGQLDIRELTVDDIEGALTPIWRTKTSAAEKALQRLGIVMRYAEAKLPEVDVRTVPRVRQLLGDQAHKVVNIPAMPWGEVSNFYKSLGDTPTELSLRLLILTASRSAPVRFAHEDQFDGDTWVIPADNMKGSTQFRIPLSVEAQRVVELARPLARGGFLFCAVRGKPISDAAMARYLNRRDLAYRPHGFRSSFRDWAQENGQDWTLAEMALAHTVGTKVERAYQRSDLLEQRRPLMQQWSGMIIGT